MNGDPRKDATWHPMINFQLKDLEKRRENHG